MFRITQWVDVLDTKSFWREELDFMWAMSMYSYSNTSEAQIRARAKLFEYES